MFESIIGGLIVAVIVSICSKLYNKFFKQK